MNQKQMTLIALGFVGTMLCVLVLGVVIGAGYRFYLTDSAPNLITKQADNGTANAEASNNTPATESGPLSPARPDPAPIDLPQTFETEKLLAETEVPQRDLRLLSSRLEQGGAPLPEVISSEPQSYALGDTDTFWVTDNSRPTPRQFQSQANLEFITDHAYWWVEEGFIVSQKDLQQSAEIFENETYPNTRRIFGSEWSPGIDKDERISVFLGNVPGVGGYYASLHEHPQEVNPHSNQREMFFVNLNALKPGNAEFDSVLAHEFQHMIHWHQDRNEETWINEGLSELATLLNGYDTNRAQNSYLSNPDLQLTTWSASPRANIPHYGSSFLFMGYVLEQYGEAVIQDIVAEQANGIQGINNALRDNGLKGTFNDIFADFVIANYLNNATLADSQWGYQAFDNPSATIDRSFKRFPIDLEATVSQYGVDYIELNGSEPLTIDFTGPTTVSLINNQAHSDQFQWYSNRGDDSNTHLTRAFDLRSLSNATLNYWAWYELEQDWDYTYVEVSTDSGQSWTILTAPHSSTTDPSGNAYGPGYTGSSRGWIEERVDLSAFAGQEILLRFETVTDDAVNGPGFALDDLSIPELNFVDDMENPDPAWQAAGFIRMDNRLRQNYIVQLIRLGEQPTVERFALDQNNQGSLTISAPDNADFKAVLVISAHAPVTTEVAKYRYVVTPVQ